MGQGIGFCRSRRDQREDDGQNRNPQLVRPCPTEALGNGLPGRLSEFSKFLFHLFYPPFCLPGLENLLDAAAELVGVGCPSFPQGIRVREPPCHLAQFGRGGAAAGRERSAGGGEGRSGCAATVGKCRRGEGDRHPRAAGEFRRPRVIDERQILQRFHPSGIAGTSVIARSAAVPGLDPGKPIPCLTSRGTLVRRGLALARRASQ